MDKLAIIHERNPAFPDTDKIQTLAQQKVDEQNKLRKLYNDSVAFIAAEEWSKALDAFNTLYEKSPEYEDVAIRLVMVSHFHELSSLQAKAEIHLKQKQFVESIDQLDEIKLKNKDYKKADIANLRQKGVENLYEHAQKLVGDEQFSEAIIQLDALAQRQADYSGLEELRQQAKVGQDRKKHYQELESLYLEAGSLLEEKKHQAVLEKWQEIEDKRGNLSFTDTKATVRLAQQGLYLDAVAALTHNSPRRALELWKILKGFASNYSDDQRVEQRAQQQLKWQKWGLWAVGVAVIAVLLFWGGWALLSEEDDRVTPTNIPDHTRIAEETQPAVSILAAATPTKTQTPKPTHTIAPTTATTPTNTPEPSATPVNTPTDTPTKTPTATYIPEPEFTAVALGPSSIFIADDEKSTVLVYIDTDEEVIVLGRSSNSHWLYVRNSAEIEGFVSKYRFEYNFDIDSLPIATPDPSYTPPATVPPPPSETQQGLTLDIWPIGDGRCNGGSWFQTIFMEGHGGDGVYTYYWDGQNVGGPVTNQSITFEIQHTGGGFSKPGRVTSGDGQVRETILFLNPPTCN